MLHNWKPEWGELTESKLRVEVPAGTVHSAEVVGEESVVSFDATRATRFPEKGGP